jgi:hypothetical protein
VVGDVEAGQVVDPPRCRDESTACPSPTRPPDGLEKRAAGGDGSPVGLRPSFDPSPPEHSHPDCRWLLTLIVAAQSSGSSF